MEDAVTPSTIDTVATVYEAMAFDVVILVTVDCNSVTIPYVLQQVLNTCNLDFDMVSTLAQIGEFLKSIRCK